MRIFYAAKDNGASAPWEMDSEWVVTINLEWQSWLFGIERHGDSYSAVWRIQFGPLSASYYRRT